MCMIIQNKLQDIQKLVDYLENTTGNGTEEELERLSKLEEIIGENPLVIKYKTICLYNSGLTQEAVEYLIDSINKYPRCYELYEIEFELLRYTDYKVNTYYALSQMYRLAENSQVQEKVLKLVEEYTTQITIKENEFKQCFELFKAEAAAIDYRSYPLDEYGNSTIRKDAFSGRDSINSYLVNMYKTNQYDIDNSNRFYYIYEMIKGRFVNFQANITANEGDILAISAASNNGNKALLNINNLEPNSIKYELEPNVIRYFKANRQCEVQIDSNQDIFVSHFKLNKVLEKPKLVLQIFIDGLSFKFLNHIGFEKLMPNTYQFFESGYINGNCHANGEWTLPSLMSMCTGKYTTNHYVFHTNEPHKGEKNNKFIQEYFEEAGYMTGRICPNWRGTPSYGYFKGTNRSIYSPMIERMNCNEVVTETLEHLETFKEFSNYVWMTIEDLHAVADGLAKGAFQDINIERHFEETVSNDSSISVFRSFNEKKIEEYKSTMKKVDFYLGILFEYISKSYNDDEFIITLNSDHGQKFIEEEDYMFTNKRTNVPFMMRGKNVKIKNSDELMSNVDIMPTLLHICGIKLDKPVDGKILKDFDGEGRDYTITESIFSGQTYKLAINDNEHLFMFESKENTRNDGRIPISDYVVKLKNRKTLMDETNIYPNKVEMYCELAFEHIREWITINI